MKRANGIFRVTAAAFGALIMAVTGTLWAQQTPAAPAASQSAAAEWAGLEAEVFEPKPPKEWQIVRPSQDVIQAWIAKESARLVALADRAHAFAARYPTDPHAAAARLKEWQALSLGAPASHDPALKARLETVETALLQDASVPQQVRFDIRVGQLQRKAQSQNDAEQMARSLVKDFPENPRAALILLQVAKGGGAEHLRAVAQEIAKGQGPAEAKAEAQKILANAERLGKPVKLQFTALDGQAVDLQKLKGKVVLIDFWATWCGPCVGEIPNVKAAYEKLHGKGFEIVGISFDKNKETLAAFLKEKGMTWPQYFDGLGWKNRFGEEFGIDSIPAMWLVDKKGVLRDQEARDGLAGKVEKLLAEP